MEAQVVRVLKEVYRTFRDVLLFPKNLLRTGHIVNSVTYYPEKERKSRRRRLAENILYLLKYHEVNIYYNS